MDKQRGFTLIEALVSCLLLAVLTTLCLELVGASMAQRKAAALREIALQEAASAMERVAATRWEDLTPAVLGKIALSREGAAALPDGVVTVQLQPSEETPLAKQITVEVRWAPARGKPALRVRLVAFRYSVSKPAEDR